MYAKKGGPGRLSGRLLAPLLIVVFALVSSVAFAGTLQVKDEEGLLSSTDRSALESAVRDYPFDVRVLTSAAHSADFDRYVGEQVSKPDMVVVGVDKEHRRTSVHFGKGSHIAQSEFHAIEQAGAPSFRSGDFRAGIEAILNRAKAAYGTAPVTDPRAASNETGAAPAQTAGGFPFGWLVLGGLVILAFIAMRRVFANRAGYQQPNFPQGQGPGYPGYGPGYGPGGGGSGLGAGIVGAGLGGLAGYELGKAMGERDEREREGGMFGGSGNNDDNDRGNWDAGGDTGGWDDSGGGGDFGGGGDDGGGGGGDGW